MMKKVVVEMFNLLHENMNDFKTLYHIQHSNQVYLQEVIQEQGCATRERDKQSFEQVLRECQSLCEGNKNYADSLKSEIFNTC